MSKIVVVTGAGAGVGRATVQEFARQGYDVALLSRDVSRLDSAAADVRKFGSVCVRFRSLRMSPMRLPSRPLRGAQRANSDPLMSG